MEKRKYILHLTLETNIIIMNPMKKQLKQQLKAVLKT